MSRIIVSLTSYGERLKETAPEAVKSINECAEYTPDLIVLYVAENERHLVKDQFRHIKNIQIRYIPDYLSHKKFYALTEKEFEDDFIVIADDDLHYKTYFLSKLFQKYEEHKNCENFIVCNRAQRLIDREYKNRKFVLKGEPDSGRMIYGSGAGVLVPPHTMRFSEELIKEGFTVSPHCDETFYSAYCIKNGIKTFCTGKPQPFYQIRLPKLDPTGLWDKYNQYEKDETFHKMFKHFDLEINERIYVSFTSWKKRIHLASKVVERMRKQTLKPYKIILTLSSDEFKNMEKDLPKDLTRMVGEDFEIKWVKENTFTFKKLEPLFYVDRNCWVLIIDDDVEYPNDFIESMYFSADPEGTQPVTGSSLKTWYREWGNVMSANGAFTLIKPVHCLPHLQLMKDYIMNITQDIASDPILTYAVFLNKISFRKSKNDFRGLQAKGDGKYPEPYSAGKEGRRRSDYTHELIHKYFKENEVKWKE